MRVLVFGAAGQVGFDLCRAEWPAGFALEALDRRAADVTDPAAVAAAFAAARLGLVINLAAYTAVDRAESEPERAMAVNARGAENLARACARAAVPLIQLSTDYVFDGMKSEPYREDDPVNPLNFYGKSKEAGERAVRALLPQHVILRTEWIYGVKGTNFVKTMLRLAGERKSLRVVADQRGAPTAAADIAAALVAIARRIGRGPVEWGTYHFAAAGEVSWYGFAEAIFDLAAAAFPAKPQVEPIATANYPTPATRPLNSVLDCSKIARNFGIAPRPWGEGLSEMLDELLAVPLQRNRQ